MRGETDMAQRHWQRRSNGHAITVHTLPGCKWNWRATRRLALYRDFGFEEIYRYVYRIRKTAA